MASVTELPRSVLAIHVVGNELSTNVYGYNIPTTLRFGACKEDVHFIHVIVGMSVLNVYTVVATRTWHT